MSIWRSVTRLAGLAPSALVLISCVAVNPSLPPDTSIGQLRAGAPVPLAAPAVPASGPLEISVSDAILLCLENNPSLRVERLNPLIRRTDEEQARAEFDPIATAGLSASERRGARDARSSSVAADAGIQKSFPGGTTLGADLSADRTWTDAGGAQYTTRTGLSVTQALLRGADVDASLATLRQSILDTRTSEYELRGFAQALLAEAEDAYWDYALARRQIEIYQKSLDLAEQQLKETEQRIQVGTVAETERAAAEAEVALRREALISARSRTETARLQLLRLLSPPRTAPWARPVTLKDQPAVQDVKADDVELHARLALRMRPEMNQARLAIRRGDLEVVRTKNGLLPRLDLFVTLGKSGYASSFGGAVRDQATGWRHDLSAGLTFEYPIGNRGPQAQYDRARLTREQAAESLANLEQLIQVDVRTAHVEAQSALEQVTATAATRKLQEEKVRAETEKFKVGKSTSILVAQAQRDLVASQIAEIEAVVNCRKALTALFRLDGSLLERRGISAPGREPAE